MNQVLTAQGDLAVLVSKSDFFGRFFDIKINGAEPAPGAAFSLQNRAGPARRICASGLEASQRPEKLTEKREKIPAWRRYRGDAAGAAGWAGRGAAEQRQRPELVANLRPQLRRVRAALPALPAGRVGGPCAP